MTVGYSGFIKNINTTVTRFELTRDSEPRETSNIYDE